MKPRFASLDSSCEIAYMIQPGPAPHPVSLSSVVQAIVASASLPLSAETRSALITALNGMTGIKEERQDLVQQNKATVQGPGKHAEAIQRPPLTYTLLLV